MALHNLIRSLRLIVHKTTWTILSPLGRNPHWVSLNLTLGLYPTAHGTHFECDWTLNVCHSIHELTSKLLVLPSIFFFYERIYQTGVSSSDFFIINFKYLFPVDAGATHIWKKANTIRWLIKIVLIITLIGICLIYITCLFWFFLSIKENFLFYWIEVIILLPFICRNNCLGVKFPHEKLCLIHLYFH